MVPGLTARKFGITPRIRLGCCFVVSRAACFADWFGAFGRSEEVRLDDGGLSGLGRNHLRLTRTGRTTTENATTAFISRSKLLSEIL